MRYISLRQTLCAAALIGVAIVGIDALPGQRQDSYGPAYYGKDPAMMSDRGTVYDQTLSAEQRSRIAKIQADVRRKHSALMSNMLSERSQLTEQLIADKRNNAAQNENIRKISELWQQMNDLSLDAQKQLEAILNK